MTVPYGSQQTLKRIYAARPEQTATPNYLAEQYIGKVAGEEAKGAAAREVRGAEVGLREKGLAQRADIFNKKLAQEATQFDVTAEIKDTAFQLQQAQFEWEKDMAKKATWFSGIKAALDLTGAWWADKQAKKVIETIVGNSAKYDQFLKETYPRMLKEILGNIETGKWSVTPIQTGGSTPEEIKLLSRASGE